MTAEAKHAATPRPALRSGTTRGRREGVGAGGAAAQRWAAPGGQESDVSGKQHKQRVGSERLATLYTLELRKCLAVILNDVVFSALEWLL